MIELIQPLVLRTSITPPPAINTTIVNPPAIQTTLTAGQGAAGVQGESGADVGSFIALENIGKGMPVYVSRANGQIGIADASVYLKSFVIGSVVDDVVAGFAVDVRAGLLVLDDWTAITGTSNLQIGFPYFLQVGGGLTLGSITKPDFAASVTVGVASSLSGLIIKPSLPFLL